MRHRAKCQLGGRYLGVLGKAAKSGKTKSREVIECRPMRILVSEKGRRWRHSAH